MAGDPRPIRPREVPFGCFEIERKEFELIHQFAGLGEGEVSADHFGGKFQREYFARLVGKGLLIRTGRGRYKALPPTISRVPTTNAMRQRPQKREPSVA